jgi:hypothetical protein
VYGSFTEEQPSKKSCDHKWHGRLSKLTIRAINNAKTFLGKSSYFICFESEALISVKVSFQRDIEKTIAALYRLRDKALAKYELEKQLADEPKSFFLTE